MPQVYLIEPPFAGLTSGQLAGRVCLVIDVLRATSVMAVLFGRGLRRLYPAGSIEAGEALHAQRDEAGLWLIGERDALPPVGFDFGNSPVEFAGLAQLAEAAVIATTNGTRALLACRGARAVVAAAPLNATAALRVAHDAGGDVLLVCAGRHGAPADDDRIAAGLFAARLREEGAQLSTAAAQACIDYEAAAGDLAAALRSSVHGRSLVDKGLGADVDLCAQVDRYDVAGVLAPGEPAVLRVT